MWPSFSVGRLKTKEGPQNSTIQSVVVKKELLNQLHLLHTTKMGTHIFREPEKAAVNLEAQRHPLQIHGFTCKLVVHDQLKSIIQLHYYLVTINKSPPSLIRVQHCSK